MRTCGILLVSVIVLLTSCSKNKVEKGVSLELAKVRKKILTEVQYSLQFDIPEDPKKSIQARNTIYFLLLKDDVKYLNIDFNESVNKITRIEVNRKPTKLIFDNEHIVVPTHLMINGYNEIQIDFIAGDQSLNRNPDYLYTLFVPDRASTCFPSFDQPDIKASISVELKIPADWEAVSNTQSIVYPDTDGKNLYQFMLSKPISTYQFAFAAGKFKKIKDEATNMTMYYRETDSVKVDANSKEIFKLHQEAISWMEEYTLIQYPFLKFDFVLIPAFQYGGMEHPGSIFYRESSLILEPTASVNQKLRRASLIAHEVAHMWFGNLVTMKWFDDVWLKEVFANLMASKIVNPQFPEINHDLRFLMAHYPSAYEIDRSAGSHPIQQRLENLKDAGTLYGAIIYQKAPIMMRNLETMMGEENFKEGLREYLKRYNYSNASWDDLIKTLTEFTDKDLQMWNTAWIKTKGMPDIAYQLGGNLEVKVTNDSAGVVWPQNFQYQVLSETPTIVDVAILSADVVKIPLTNANSKIIPNYKGKGYGYFSADEASRKNMLATVHTLEDAEARAAVWLNIWEYVLRGELDVREVLDSILGNLAREKDPLIFEYLTHRLNTLFWQFTKLEDRQLISEKLDEELFDLMALQKDISLKRTLFNCFIQVATSNNGVLNLKKFWRNEMTLGLEITEQDHIQLAYEIAVRDADGAEATLKTQLENTKNPDRKSAMAFIMPALSASEVARDAFFESLKKAENREHEPWVLEALGYLHHPLRSAHSIKYIKPSLEMMEEIQLTGDIFFPKGWVDETLSSYQSAEAASIVRTYLQSNPGLSPNLKNKVLQAADVLFRAEKILTSDTSKPM